MRFNQILLRFSLVFLASCCGIDVFSQGANSNNFEVISRVYFGSIPSVLLLSEMVIDMDCVIALNYNFHQLIGQLD